MERVPQSTPEGEEKVVAFREAMEEVEAGVTPVDEAMEDGVPEDMTEDQDIDDTPMAA